jgi:hypothetical protein
MILTNQETVFDQRCDARGRVEEYEIYRPVVAVARAAHPTGAAEARAAHFPSTWEVVALLISQHASHVRV